MPLKNTTKHHKISHNNSTYWIPDSTYIKILPKKIRWFKVFISDWWRLKWKQLGSSKLNLGFIRWWIEHLTNHVTDAGWFRLTNYKRFSVYFIPKMHCFNDPIDTTDNYLEPEKSEPQTILTFSSQSMNHTLWFHSDLRSLLLDDFMRKIWCIRVKISIEFLLKPV